MNVRSRRAASRLAILLAATLALFAASCSGGSDTAKVASSNWDELVWDAGNWE